MHCVQIEYVNRCTDRLAALSTDRISLSVAAESQNEMLGLLHFTCCQLYGLLRDGCIVAVVYIEREDEKLSLELDGLFIATVLVFPGFLE